MYILRGFGGYDEEIGDGCKVDRAVTKTLSFVWGSWCCLLAAAAAGGGGVGYCARKIMTRLLLLLLHVC